MLPRSLGSKTVTNLGDLGAATLLAAVPAAALASPLVAGAAVAGCVGLLAVWSFWGAKDADDVEEDAERRFRALLNETSTLKGALQKISAGQTETQMFSAEKAAQLLQFFEAADRDVRSAIADNQELLVFVGRKIEESFSETKGQLDAIQKAIAQSMAQLARQDEQTQAILEIARRLESHMSYTPIDLSNYRQWVLATTESFFSPSIAKQFPSSQAWGIVHPLNESHGGASSEGEVGPRALADQIRRYHEWHRLGSHSRPQDAGA